jgi:streptogramin lyase
MNLTRPFEAIEGWEQLPEGFTHADVSGVAVDSEDRLFVLTRGTARVIVYEPDGTFVRSWGEDIFTERTHSIFVGPDGMVYTTDDGDHTVRKFTPEGEQLLIIGNPGVPSDTGYNGSDLTSIKRGGAPFNKPTGTVVGPDGDIFVCDGYGNARVHRFTAKGEIVTSWGEPGTGPGEFFLPHGITLTTDGRLLVADRENDRIQIFSTDGELLDIWDRVQRPTDVRVSSDGLIFVTNLWWRKGMESFTYGVLNRDLPAGISVLDSDGNLLLSCASSDRCAPGNFTAPHTICVDSKGAIYVGEVTYTYAVKPGLVDPDCHTLQKLVPAS